MLKQTVAVSLLMLASQQALAAYKSQYEVTVQNITRGQSFTPIIAASHTRSFKPFVVGDKASDAIAALAEGGMTAPLKADMEASSAVKGIAVTEGLLGPGQKVTFTLESVYYARRFSMAAMLLPTNDTFVGVSAKWLPRWGTRVMYAKAWDAGSETNDEKCEHIPGPRCGGEALSADDNGEGFIYPSPGMHGEGDLKQSVYDWHDPVAKITIRRTR
ncbi:hypothetical protein NFHSH190041_35560 [Shewanella sp. NFH-SH190041]|uniref:spondin domain-containing protein n=1 Tax=Shewanella sp. NFH-SH190041 TaxID=2950245 RepID=UPI0021C2A25B|nr:spondin domain-containing protein [Shewanella sp. NFH-SH190041]BDM66104.1 hypothetical protein NFHSH190041_35560 [Shewanella sp. NFH-SH190041]